MTTGVVARLQLVVLVVFLGALVLLFKVLLEPMLDFNGVPMVFIMLLFRVAEVLKVVFASYLCHDWIVGAVSLLLFVDDYYNYWKLGFFI